MGSDGLSSGMPQPMSDLLPSYLTNFWPAVSLAVGFPLLLLLLNESIASCRRRGLPVERTMRNLRNLVVPAADGGPPPDLQQEAALQLVRARR